MITTLIVVLVMQYIDRLPCAETISICYRRERCHTFLDTTATLCHGVEEYRSFCENAMSAKDVSLIISSIETRFHYCL